MYTGIKERKPNNENASYNICFKTALKTSVCIIINTAIGCGIDIKTHHQMI